MIVAQQMQDAVHHQQLQFGAQRVAGGLGLRPRRGQRNGNIAIVAHAGGGVGPGLAARERQHVGGMVFIPELAVELMQRGIVRDQHRERGGAGRRLLFERRPGCRAQHRAVNLLGVGRVNFQVNRLVEQTSV